MARQPHFDLPCVPPHVVQRGVDRKPCFADTADYLHYRQALSEAALKHGCALHAYVLMTNHVHLLLTPSDVGGVSRMMQALGRRYVAGFNARYRRTGTLWEGRFKAALVDSERYVLACYRYIELNPVRARMVAGPGDYRWSNYHANALGQAETRVNPHPTYLALGNRPEARSAAYRELVDGGLPQHDAPTRSHSTRTSRSYGAVTASSASSRRLLSAASMSSARPS